MALDVAVPGKGGAGGALRPALDREGSRVRHGDEAEDAEDHVGHAPESVPRDGTVMEQRL